MRTPMKLVHATACLALAFAFGCNSEPTKDAPKAKAPASKAGAAAPASEAAAKAPASEAAAAKAPTSAPAAKAPGDDAAPAAGDGPKVTLIEPGAEPRTALRLKLAQGDSVTAEMIMKMKMKMDLNGMKPPEMAIPPTRMLMKMEVTDAQPDLFSYTFEVTEAAPMDAPGVQPMVMNAMKTALKNAEGLKGKGSVDGRGINKGASFELPEKMDPQTRQLMDGMRDAVGRMSAPLPAEPVGVGGKWSVEQTLAQNGMSVDQTATYTVTAIEGDSVKMDVAVKMNAPEQDVKAPGMPPGAKMHLDSMTGEGTGKTHQLLTSVLPKLAEVSVSTAMKSTVETMGQTQKMAMDMQMDVTIKPVAE